MKKTLFTIALLSSSVAMAQISFSSANSVSISASYLRATVDMNGDYLDDIVGINGSSIIIMYQQPNGTFVTSTIGTTQITNSPDWSLAVGDFDKNGFNDIVYGGGGGVTFMKANATGTAYTEVAYPQYVFSQRSNFVDLNNDGHLDGFMCHDVNPNVYYLNDGSGNLVYHQGGIGDHPEGGNYGSIWVDYDNDGDMDCFIAKCRGGGSTASIDELHRNNGDGTFTNVAVAANMDHGYHQSWSAAWNDYDNDGDMDAMIGSSDGSQHILKRNNGDGTFTDVTAGSGFDNSTGTSIEHVSFDFDNDGFADILSGGGIMRRNNGDMTFTQVAISATGSSIADLNNDGFLDLFSSDFWNSSANIYYNTGNNNNWIKIQIKGIASNYNGIGARVEIYGAWGKQIRDVRSGDGFANMNTLNVHFGIGTATEIDSVRVLWPSGQVDVVENPTINTPLTIIEGSLSLAEINGQKITVFPNPTAELLSLENIQLLDVKEIAIYAVSGEKVMIKNTHFETIDVSQLAEGSYILLIQTATGQRFSEAFVKKNR